ncbi:SDR family NAD(P)-dependent oxidoreductase [Phytoactinopolyspora endophytica]|uniref:SDR family NAD(P)-dependent oxidoreductase n=1 Tax=Phytoactinopolyspora endophytica TaxID=1642495 RepID=UPI00197B6A8F|nr:SDR family NAD(P)-dependent oxidoreductase [Phytoactinopolyspora endophytica]
MSKDRTILVTGSTDGVGRRVVEKLAAPGVHLLVHGRDTARGKAVVSSIERAGGSATFFEADFDSLADVRRLAQAVQAEHTQLDALVNNAGISKPSGPRRESADGFERHFAINYLAHFLLTRLLRPNLGAQAPSRVVNVVSAAQNPIDFDNLMLEYGYGGYRAYGQSKLAQVMLTFDLAEEYAGADITANCLHPGTHLDTTMVREAGISPANSADAGADAILSLIAPNDTTERYFDGKWETRAHRQAYDRETRRRLKVISRRLTELDL